MSILYDNAGNPVSEDNPLPIKSMASSIIQPIDIQSHLQQTIQTHNAVSVGGNATSVQSNFIDCDGFADIAVTLLNDASTSFGALLYWSNDGVNTHGTEYAISTGTPVSSNAKSGSVPTKARYVKIGISNLDTVAHTMSAWAYLKA